MLFILLVSIVWTETSLLAQYKRDSMVGLRAGVSMGNMTGKPDKPYKRPYGGTLGPPVMYTKPVDPDIEGAGYGYSNAEGFEEDVFYYHTDHLGSTSYITDGYGEVTQFVC